MDEAVIWLHSHLAIYERENVCEEEHKAQTELPTQWKEHYVEKEAKVLKVADALRHRTLPLKDLAEGQNRANVLAYFEELVSISVRVKGEVRIEPLVYIHLEILAFYLLFLLR